MSKIFFSFRLDESQDAISRISTELKLRIDPENSEDVFTDARDIPPGNDFHQNLSETIRSSDILIVAIADNWHEAKNADGIQLLQDPADIVRTEIETALIYGVTIIPVLISGAMLPLAEQLPPSLLPLASTMASPVRSTSDFDEDIAQLTARIKRHINSSIEEDKNFESEQTTFVRFRRFKKKLRAHAYKAVFAAVAITLTGAVIPLAASIQENIESPKDSVYRELPFTTTTRLPQSIFSELSGTVKIRDSSLTLTTDLGIIGSNLDHETFVQSARFGLARKSYAFDRFKVVSWAEPHKIMTLVDKKSYLNLAPLQSTITVPPPEFPSPSAGDDSESLKDHWLVFQVSFDSDSKADIQTVYAHSAKDIFSTE